MHATSKSALGPYARQGVALSHQAHNPQTIRLADGRYYIFHIGTADSKGPAMACNETGSGQPPSPAATPPDVGTTANKCPDAPPTYTRTTAACIANTGCHAKHCSCGGGARRLSSGDCTAIADCVELGTHNCSHDDRCYSVAVRSDCSSGGTTTKRFETYSEGASSTVPNSDWVVYSRAGAAPPPPPSPSPPPSPWSAGSTLHSSRSLAGPWVPVLPGPTKCNNPSPFLHPNGTLFLACTWTLRRSLSGAATGPWSEPWPIDARRPLGTWECVADPSTHSRPWSRASIDDTACIRIPGLFTAEIRSCSSIGGGDSTS